MPRALGLLLLALAASCGGESEPEPAVAVSITAPADGATVPTSFRVEMAAEGLAIEPAGEVAEGSGHFHLMVDAGCVATGEQIPADESHVHLADGAAETELTLAPGEHALCLQAGDGQHAALDLTHEITVTVEEGETPTESGATGAGDQLEAWEGTYEGEVVWDCGAAGTHRGTVEADVHLAVWETTTILNASHTIAGSCADTGELTTPISVGGIERTDSGFTIPSDLWGVPGSFTLRTNGTRASGRLSGAIPGPARLTIVFDLECTYGC